MKESLETMEIHASKTIVAIYKELEATYPPQVTEYYSGSKDSDDLTFRFGPRCLATAEFKFDIRIYVERGPPPEKMALTFFENLRREEHHLSGFFAVQVESVYATLFVFRVAGLK